MSSVEKTPALTCAQLWVCTSVQFITSYAGESLLSAAPPDVSTCKAQALHQNLSVNRLKLISCESSVEAVNRCALWSDFSQCHGEKLRHLIIVYDNGMLRLYLMMRLWVHILLEDESPDVNVINNVRGEKANEQDASPSTRLLFPEECLLLQSQMWLDSYNQAIGSRKWPKETHSLRISAFFSCLNDLMVHISRTFDAEERGKIP